MARKLLDDEPVFARSIAELEPVFVEQVGYSLWTSCRAARRSAATPRCSRC
jgi:acyl transferase domain-containing protein